MMGGMQSVKENKDAWYISYTSSRDVFWYIAHNYGNFVLPILRQFHLEVLNCTGEVSKTRQKECSIRGLSSLRQELHIMILLLKLHHQKENR